MKVKMEISGCDDTTEVEMDNISESEFALLELISNESKALGGGCKPVVDVQVIA